MTLAYSTTGVLHVTAPGPDSPLLPTGEGWSLRDQARTFRRRVHFEDRPARIVSAPVESDSVIWNQILGNAPGCAREYILRGIAGDFAGTGKMLRLSRSDANRLVFGSGLSKAEQHRNYLSASGYSFDSFVHDIAVPDLHPESYEWNGETRGDVEAEFTDELHSIVQTVTSSRHARSILIQEYRDQKRAEQREIEVPF